MAAVVSIAPVRSLYFLLRNTLVSISFHFHFKYLVSLILLFEGTFKFYWIKISVKKIVKKTKWSSIIHGLNSSTCYFSLVLYFMHTHTHTRFSLSCSLVVLLFSRRDLKYDFSFVTSCLWFFKPWNGSNVEPGETKKYKKTVFAFSILRLRNFFSNESSVCRSMCIVWVLTLAWMESITFTIYNLSTFA